MRFFRLKKIDWWVDKKKGRKKDRNLSKICRKRGLKKELCSCVWCSSAEHFRKILFFSILRGGYTVSISYENFRPQGENFRRRFAVQHPTRKGGRKTYYFVYKMSSLEHFDGANIQLYI